MNFFFSIYNFTNQDIFEILRYIFSEELDLDWFLFITRKTRFNFTYQDSEGNTLPHHIRMSAVVEYYLNLLNLMTDYNTDFNIKNNRGDTVFDKYIRDLFEDENHNVDIFNEFSFVESIFQMILNNGANLDLEKLTKKLRSETKHYMEELDLAIFENDDWYINRELNFDFLEFLQKIIICLRIIQGSLPLTQLPSNMLLNLSYIFVEYQKFLNLEQGSFINQFMTIAQERNRDAQIIDKIQTITNTTVNIMINIIENSDLSNQRDLIVAVRHLPDQHKERIYNIVINAIDDDTLPNDIYEMIFSFL